MFHDDGDEDNPTILTITNHHGQISQLLEHPHVGTRSAMR